MYRIEASGELIANYSDAIRAAEKLNCNVIDNRNNCVRWRPLPPVSSKKMRMYKERLAAYEAQKLQDSMQNNS